MNWTIIESIGSDRGDGIGDGDSGQSTAVVERVVADGCDGRWDGDGGYP